MTINYIKKSIFIELASFAEREIANSQVLNLDYDIAVEIIDRAAVSSECLEKNRKVLYDIVDK